MEFYHPPFRKQRLLVFQDFNDLMETHKAKLTDDEEGGVEEAKLGHALFATRHNTLCKREKRVFKNKEEKGIPYI